MAPHEKRASTRYEVELEMEVVAGDQSVTAQAVNLSLGGALVRIPTERPLRVGARIGVSFRLPDLDKPLVAKADVRWVDDGDPEVVGFQFVTGFRAKETWALGRFLERHKPT
ncbi:MAG: PilZ domain-containing protein [Myxococcales bacterium]|nr:PilZ domain-containing protein [Myxococcales bacterium]MCB9713058.1 PilZ domain-containing protein [Myxococcales bacterium]